MKRLLSHLLDGIAWCVGMLALGLFVIACCAACGAEKMRDHD